MKTRPPIERFAFIARSIQREPMPSSRLAVDMEVSRKTIERDIAFMRDRLQLPIVATGKGYSLARSVTLCRCCGGVL
jgi:predicted DNA-binding transcriptional regulator YafY